MVDVARRGGRVLGLLPVLTLMAAGCTGGGLADGWRETPPGDGPMVEWDLTAEPLPEIPLPNDVATWPDPTSPTGRRINASTIAPSGMETRLRQNFDRLDGWGTFAPITVSFDEPIDTDALEARQGRGRFGQDDFQRHAIYLIDMTTGVPVPIDVGTGRFPLGAVEPSGYWSNDPRGGETNLILETVDEDADGDGELDPGEDTDFDGVLDEPNVPGGELRGVPLETYDRLLSFYERQTHTLLLRPIVPLDGAHEYAVVLTDRLVGLGGQPVQSPFDHVHHVAQHDSLAALPGHFEQHAHIYGDLASRGWDGVAFAWTFTTQSIGRDLHALREGLYGRGPFARLAEQFPAVMRPARMRGGTRTMRCHPEGNIYVTGPEQLRQALDDIPIDSFGVAVEQIDAVLGALEESVSHFAFGFYESPYLLDDPEQENPNDVWVVDAETGEARIDRDLVPMMITIPKETDAHRQPFPVTMYSHGYGSINLEQVAFAGHTAAQGIATVSINAQGHGLPLDQSLLPLVESVLASSCLAPLGTAVLMDRARDLNGDDTADSAGLFFSAYMFHTRDALRQSVLDTMQGLRIVRSFLGHPDFPEGRRWEAGELPTGDPFDGDLDGDGEPELMGDFDADGTVDLGGWERPYYQWGSSLGGIISMLVAGTEPTIQAAAPVSGAGGLFDVGMRTGLGTAKNPIWLRVMGPLVTAVPSGGPSDETGCVAGERSVRFEVPDLAERAEVEIACLGEDELREGDAVVLRDFANRETACAGVGPDGRFRLAVPADRGDALAIEVYRGVADEVDYEQCEVPQGAELVDRIRQWRSENGRNEPGSCRRCARYRNRIFEPGEPLVAPVEGLGLQRQTPDLRRLANLAQIAVDRADPINYARRVFLDPVTAEDAAARKRSIFVLNTLGDDAVPTASGNAYARAAGILPFLPPAAPDELADWRAPTEVQRTWGVPTPDDVLLDEHVIEGLPFLDRHPVEGASAGFAFDVDDMSEGKQWFDADGEDQVDPDGEEPAFRPHRLDPPLRWARESRPASEAPGMDPWRGRGDYGAYSTVINAMIKPEGNHVVLPTNPTDQFDEGEYLIGAIGWYLVSGGSDIVWKTHPDDHHCLETSSCVYGED